MHAQHTLVVEDSPVRGLFGQICSTFETAGPGMLEKLHLSVTTGVVSPQLDLDNRALPPDSPSCSLPKHGEPAQITIGLSYLEFLWAFSYAAFVRYESEMHARMKRDALPLAYPEFESTIIKRAHTLDTWAKSLRAGYSSWPSDTPSPRDPGSIREKEISGKVNTVFIHAVALVLLHEFAHAVQGHLDAVARGASVSEQCDMEKEADQYAYDMMLGNDASEGARKLAAWSVLIPALAWLWLVKRPAGLVDSKHPAVHHRIAYALQRLDFHDLHNHDYFTGACLPSLHEFAYAHGLLKPEEWPGRFDDAATALTFYLDILDQHLRDMSVS